MIVELGTAEALVAGETAAENIIDADDVTTATGCDRRQFLDPRDGAAEWNPLLHHGGRG